MGQYHLITNLTKKEFIDPYAFNDGVKLREFGGSGCGTLMGLTVLLSDSDGRGGGDFNLDNPIVGAWAGDRITISGDYGDEGQWCDDKTQNLYDHAKQKFIDISEELISAMCENDEMKKELVGRGVTVPDRTSSEILMAIMRRTKQRKGE